ncbi:MAG: GAF domain-containing sensor histidine kinase, partial [Candidatus Limnocylindrales bacterium]
LGLIIHEGRAYRVRDIAAHPDRFGFPHHHPSMHSFLGVPVRVGEEPVGNLYLTEKAGGDAFSESDQRLVESFALHAGIAIQNARLHARVQALAVVEDRERIGKDLHDRIIQALYGVGLSLEDVPDLLAEEPDEAARRVERAIESLHHTIRDIRNFIFELQPELLGGTTLVAGAVQLVEEFRRDTPVEADLRLDRVQAEPPTAVVREVLAIMSEALSNVARHAHAGVVVVELDGGRDGLTLTVTDDGIGLPEGAEGLIGHQGLRNMRARAERLGADVVLEPLARPGHGTRVKLALPAGTLQR